MVETRLTLNSDEKEYLLRLLRTAVGETRVEVHRTHTPNYREMVLAEEVLLKELISKLEKAA